ncbi:hypothetical protein [Methylobacillus flagellatus]|uniref:hypothetical protein n=1 Tax=Methylobacillus flagellatus TaxID=405 RepID=UPI0000544BFE|nr:hypothetical protein [Methylobacillus flagellatus]
MKLKAFLQAHSLNIFAAVGLLASILILGLKATELGRLQEILTLDIYQQLTQKLFTQANIMAELVLGKYLDEFAVPSLLITFAFIIIFKVFYATGLVNTILSVFAITAKPLLVTPPVKTILNAGILISLINIFLIITKVFVLSGRYVIALALILMIYATFYMAYLFDRYKAGFPKSRAGRAILWVIPASILIGLLTNLWPKPTGFNHEQDAIRWLKEHHIDNQDVFFDSARLRYYAGAPFIGSGGRFVLDSIHKGKNITKPFVVIGGINKRHPEQQEAFAAEYPHYKEIARFNGPYNKKYTVIYQKITPQ